MIDHIQAHFDIHGFSPYAVEFRRDHTFIGFIGLNIPSFDALFTPCVEVAWRLDPEYWGQGLATEGARAVTEFGFQQLKLWEVVAFTVPANLRSRRVMEKLGMKHSSADDFDHPQLPTAHPLCRHVLYRLSLSDWRNSVLVR
jgi:RimJ/RimL family protein N-acetyltransferase